MILSLTSILDWERNERTAAKTERPSEAIQHILIGTKNYMYISKSLNNKRKETKPHNKFIFGCTRCNEYYSIRCLCARVWTLPFLCVCVSDYIIALGFLMLSSSRLFFSCGTMCSHFVRCFGKMYVTSIHTLNNILCVCCVCLSRVLHHVLCKIKTTNNVSGETERRDT